MQLDRIEDHGNVQFTAHKHEGINIKTEEKIKSDLSGFYNHARTLGYNNFKINMGERTITAETGGNPNVRFSSPFVFGDSGYVSSKELNKSLDCHDVNNLKKLASQNNYSQVEIEGWASSADKLTFKQGDKKETIYIKSSETYEHLNTSTLEKRVNSILTKGYSFESTVPKEIIDKNNDLKTLLNTLEQKAKNTGKIVEVSYNKDRESITIRVASKDGNSSGGTGANLADKPLLDERDQGILDLFFK